MAVDARILSIGTLSAHPLWDESAPVRSGHATTTLIEAEDAVIVVKALLAVEVMVVVAMLSLPRPSKPKDSWQRSGLRRSGLRRLALRGEDTWPIGDRGDDSSDSSMEERRLSEAAAPALSVGTV